MLDFLRTLLHPMTPPIVLILTIVYVVFMILAQLVIDYWHSQKKHLNFPRPDNDADNVFTKPMDGYADMLADGLINLLYAYFALKIADYHGNNYVLIGFVIVWIIYEIARLVVNYLTRNNKAKQKLIQLIFWIVIIAGYLISLLA